MEIPEGDSTADEFVDRRHEYRRKDDGPIQAFFVRTGKVAAAAVAIGTLIGCVGAFVGIRLTGTHDDVAEVRRESRSSDSVLSARIDSTAAHLNAMQQGQRDIVDGLHEMKASFDQQAFIQCAFLRRYESDLRPKGCDAAERRAARDPQR